MQPAAFAKFRHSPVQFPVLIDTLGKIPPCHIGAPFSGQIIHKAVASLYTKLAYGIEVAGEMTRKLETVLGLVMSPLF